MSVGSRGVAAVTKVLPVLAKQLPKLWPLLLESKNRERVGELAREVASSSPRRKLAGKMELTEVLAQTMADQADTDVERERARGWQRRAQRMRVRLDMPVQGVRGRHTHRADLRHDLTALHEEMSDALRDEPPAAD